MDREHRRRRNYSLFHPQAHVKIHFHLLSTQKSLTATETVKKTVNKKAAVIDTALPEAGIDGVNGEVFVIR